MRTRLFYCILGMIAIVAAQNSFGQTDQKLGGQQINQASNIETAVVAEPLDGRVNSAFIEYGPTLTKDGKRLYFSRQGHPKNTGGAKDEDIWYCEFVDSTQTWTEATRMDVPLNN